MDCASFSKQTCSRHALRGVCIPNDLEALKGLQTIALKFHRSNAEGIALSMKTRYYVICFQHLFSAMLHLYPPVISLLLSPVHPKSLLQWTALGHRSSLEGLYSIWKFQRATLQALMFILSLLDMYLVIHSHETCNTKHI